VFFGMLGVTFFGLIFTPVFYVFMRWIGTLQIFGAVPVRPTTEPQANADGSP
jgi:HAE1 family hydrophobic/amphiphilic exporter-1